MYAKYWPSYAVIGLLESETTAEPSNPVITCTRLLGEAVHPNGNTPPSKLSNWQMKDADGDGVPDELELEVRV